MLWRVVFEGITVSQLRALAPCRGEERRDDGALQLRKIAALPTRSGSAGAMSIYRCYLFNDDEHTLGPPVRDRRPMMTSQSGGRGPFAHPIRGVGLARFGSLP